MSEVNAPVKRNVGFLLGVGILLFPMIFAWFLLRKGHSTWARIVGFGWMILAILAISGSGPTPTNHSSKSQSTAGSTPASVNVPAEPLKSYTAAQIASSYEQNTVAADMQFKGKRVQVSGRVTAINTDFMGNPYLVLAGTNEFLGPQFEFDKSSIEALAAIKKGAAVKLICVGKGDVIKTPMFEACEIAR